MAQKIEEFPQGSRHGTRTYPWEEWQDGSAWKLQRGAKKDFDAPIDQFRNRCYTRAKNVGLAVRTSKLIVETDDEAEEFLIVQFFDPEHPAAGHLATANGARGA
jgi:hypothetical protein